MSKKCTWLFVALLLSLALSPAWLGPTKSNVTEQIISPAALLSSGELHFFSISPTPTFDGLSTPRELPTSIQSEPKGAPAPVTTTASLPSATQRDRFFLLSIENSTYKDHTAS